MSHEVNFPDYLWRLAQQQSGMSNPASWIRNRIGELLTGALDEQHRTLLAKVAAEAFGRLDEGLPLTADDPLPALGIYAKTDHENFIRYSIAECDGDSELALKALASKDNPTAFLQWWADKQTPTEREQA